VTGIPGWDPARSFRFGLQRIIDGIGAFISTASQ
jgi:hypothetical protein